MAKTVRVVLPAKTDPVGLAFDDGTAAGLDGAVD